MKTILSSVLRFGWAALMGIGAASAQQFPSKPVRLVVANAPGSQADLLARILAQELGKHWPQPVLVENRGPAASSQRNTPPSRRRTATR